MTRSTLYTPFMRVGASLAVLALSACVNLRPAVPQAEVNIPGQLPAKVASTSQASTDTSPPPASPQHWRQVFTDPAQTQLIEAALQHNADLQVAMLNMDRARALYQVVQADEWPRLDANLSGTRQRSSTTLSNGRLIQPQQVRATLGFAAYELDVFGRIQNLNAEALERYLATEFARDSVQLALIADVVSAHQLVQSNQARRLVAEQQLRNLQQAEQLVARRKALGVASELDLNLARSNLEQAQISQVQAQRALQVSRNALQLLVGRPLEPLTPTANPSTQTIEAPKLPNWLATPGGLSSDVLLQRPDVMQAEALLRASNARIGAARAAFFPSIRLTAEVGRASPSLNDLWESGSRTWLFTPTINLPIFDGGRNQANLKVAEVDQELALVRYRQAVQTAFREVADVLAELDSLQQEEQSRMALLAQSERGLKLALARYQQGLDSYLQVIEAQRLAYNVQLGVVELQQRQTTSRALLFKVLGGR